MSFARYPAYKDSGVEWLGEVPEHWELKPLKHLAEFSGGGTPSRDVIDYWHGDIPWVSPKDMKTECIMDSEERITELGLRSSSTTLIPSGAVLLVVRSGILKHTIPVAINRFPVALNQDMKALRFDPSCMTAAFFLRFVQGLNDTLLLQWGKQGATVESVEHDYLANSTMPIPPLAEQVAITTFLDHETGKIDALMAEQQQLIELLQEKRQAVISHAVTKGLDPSVPMKDSGVDWLEEVPAHWEVRALRRVIDSIEQGWSPACHAREADEQEWGVLKAGCLNGGLYRPSENKALPSELEPQECYEVRVGDVLMSRASGSPELVGSTARVTTTRARLMLSDKIFRLQLQDAVNSRFFVAALNSRPLRVQIENALSGGNGMANNLPQSSLLTFVMPVPPLAEQVDIATFLDREATLLDALVTEARAAITLLQERRTALISAAVTGQIDVRGWEGAVPN